MPVNDDTIVRVAGRGDGVTGDGRHVALAAPGDRITAEGGVIPGPNHQRPPCKHFPICGGCQLQHLDDSAWSQFIIDRIGGALATHGLSAEIRAPLLSPPKTRRRATLHAERRGRQVHLALTDQGRDVLIDGMDAEGLAAIEALTAFARRHKLARLSIDEGFGATARWEPEPVTVTLGGVPVPFPAGSFLQATAEGEAALVAAVQEIAGDAEAVADLFAGLGTFTFAFPRSRVYAAEGARDPILSLKAAAAQAGRQVFADHRDLFRRPVSPSDLDHFDAIVLDPPRAGAKEQVAELAASKVPLIAYVSCNPGTFVRDAEVLCKGGYRIDWVQPVGQFRWSTHIELAARFSR